MNCLRYGYCCVFLLKCKLMCVDTDRFKGESVSREYFGIDSDGPVHEDDKHTVPPHSCTWHNK